MAFFKSKDIPRPMAFFMNAGFSKPLPDSPHISGTLDNVTVEGVLDRILQTFPGVWFYGNCVQDENHKRASFDSIVSTRIAIGFPAECESRQTPKLTGHQSTDAIAL